MSSGRVAVMRESSWRSEPAAALRGLANGGSPACDALGVELLEGGAREDHLAAHLETGRHRPAARAGAGAAATERMVRTLAVTSSPLMPSPRVEAMLSAPST